MTHPTGIRNHRNTSAHFSCFFPIPEGTESEALMDVKDFCYPDCSRLYPSDFQICTSSSRLFQSTGFSPFLVNAINAVPSMIGSWHRVEN